MSALTGFKEYHFRRAWNVKFYLPNQFKQSVEALQQSMIAGNRVLEEFCNVCCERWETGLLEPQGSFHRTGFAAEILLKSAAKTTDLKELLKNFGLYDVTLWSKFVNENDENDWLDTEEGQKYPQRPPKSIPFPHEMKCMDAKPLYFLYNKYLNTSYEDPIAFVQTYKQEQFVFDTVFPCHRNMKTILETDLTKTDMENKDDIDNRESGNAESQASIKSYSPSKKLKREQKKELKNTSKVDLDRDSTFSDVTSLAMKTSFPKKVEPKSGKQEFSNIDNKKKKDTDLFSSDEETTSAKRAKEKSKKNLEKEKELKQSANKRNKKQKNI